MTFWTEGLQTPVGPKVLEDYTSGTGPSIGASFGAGYAESLGLEADTAEVDRLQYGYPLQHLALDAPNDPGQPAREQPSSEILPFAEVDRRIQASGQTLKEVPPNVRADTLDFLLQRQRAKQVRDDLLNRSQSGLFATPARFAVRFAANMLDPINVASAFVPVIGPERYAALLAKVGFAGRTAIRAGVGAVEGSVGQALIEPLRYSEAKGLGDDYTLNDSLANIAYGTVFGGGLHVMAGGAADALKWRTAKATSKIAREIASAPLDVKADLLKTAFSQMATGHEIDVQGMMDLHAASAAPAAPPERVAAAALKIGDQIFTGPAHGDAYEAALAAGVKEADISKVDMNGFVTDQGRYVSRDEALQIARDSGQKHREVAGNLTSQGTTTPTFEELQAAKAAPEKITAAAVRVGDQIFTGVHHAEAADKAAKALGKPVHDVFDAKSFEGDGFITNKGRYVSRAEAVKIAARADQIDTVGDMTPQASRDLVEGTGELLAEQLKPGYQSAADSITEAARNPQPRLTDEAASARAEAAVKDSPPAKPGDTAEIDAAQASLDTAMEDITRLSKQYGVEEQAKAATKELNTLDADAKTYRRALEAAAVCGANT